MQSHQQPFHDVPFTSVYWGFFSGGARNVHTDTILSLKEHGIDHRVLHYYDVLDRGDEGIQSAQRDSNYSKLKNAGIPIDSLGLDELQGINPYATLPSFHQTPASAQEESVQRLAHALSEVKAPVILCLKEQPANLLVEANRYREEILHLPVKPLIITLHRTDPGLQDQKAMAMLRALEHNPATKRMIAGYIACAESATLAYQNALGLEHEPERFKTVSNGINLDVFHPQSDAKKRAFIERYFPLDVQPDLTTPIVTLGARNSAEKNPRLFLEAAWQFLQQNPQAHVALCGTGMTDAGLAELMYQTLVAHGLPAKDESALLRRIHCLGRLQSGDMATLCSLSSVMALTSPTLGEADPLVLKEGMACGAIPVSTSTGDTPSIVGVSDAKAQMLKPVEAGFRVGSRGVLTAQNPQSIAQAWDYAIDHKRDFKEPIALYTPLLNRTFMGNGYRHAILELSNLVQCEPSTFTTQREYKRTLRGSDEIRFR